MHPRFQALDAVVHMKPDFIVLNASFNELQGEEIAWMTRVMRVTKNIPRSYCYRARMLRMRKMIIYPDGVEFIQKNNDFADELIKKMNDLI